MQDAQPLPPPPAPAGPAPARAPAWTVGTAVALTFAAARRGAAPLLGACLLAQLPLTLLQLVPVEGMRLTGSLYGLLGVLQAGLVAAGVGALLRGERPRLGAMFSAVGTRFGALLLQAFLGGLAVAIGLALLVVPGLVLWAGFAVSAPAVLAERGLKANEGLQRSWDLTRGRRLPTFLASLIFFGALLAALFGAALLAEALEIAEAWQGLLLADLLPLPFQVASGACPAVLYHLLREEREGADPARLAAVFE